MEVLPVWGYNPLSCVHVHPPLALRERGRLRQAGPTLQESIISPRAAGRAPPHMDRGFRIAPTPPGVIPSAAAAAAGGTFTSGGGSIFWLLPAFNLAVLALELAYQVCVGGGRHMVPIQVIYLVGGRGVGGAAPTCWDKSPPLNTPPPSPSPHAGPRPFPVPSLPAALNPLQAPIQLLLPGDGWDEPCRRRQPVPPSPGGGGSGEGALPSTCSFPQLLGLCKFSGAAGGEGVGCRVVTGHWKPGGRKEPWIQGRASSASSAEMKPEAFASLG